MNFDTTFLGPQGVVDDDQGYSGSRFAEVRAALFANPYYEVWGREGNPPLPTYGVTLGRILAGILSPRKRWQLLQAARRTLDSLADLRWGSDGRGYRRLLHPNAVCLTGRWKIDKAPAGKSYSGYFRAGSEALIVGRYSTCCTETRVGHNRSLSLVAKLHPTVDPDHVDPLQTANFITQEDLGGAKTPSINAAVLRNAPDTTPWRRGLGFPILLLTGLAFRLSDREPTFRQLYPIAELGKPEADATSAPEFMQLVMDPEPSFAGPKFPDFRDEVLAHIYDPGDPKPRRKLTFHIEVCDEGKTKGLLRQRRYFGEWQRIGRIEFDEGVASYNGDFVIHFHHPPWRNDRNNPATQVRPAPCFNQLASNSRR